MRQPPAAVGRFQGKWDRRIAQGLTRGVEKRPLRCAARPQSTTLRDGPEPLPSGFIHAAYFPASGSRVMVRPGTELPSAVVKRTEPAQPPIPFATLKTNTFSPAFSSTPDTSS